MNLIEHYIDLHNYIHDNIYMLDNNYNQLFEATILNESIQYLIEMNQTPARKDLAMTLKFDNFRIGLNEPKDPSLTLKVIDGDQSFPLGNNKTTLLNLVYTLALSILKDKCSENYGQPTSVNFSIDRNHKLNEIYISIFNELKKEELKKMDFNLSEKVREKANENKIQSQSLNVELKNNDSWDKFWNYTFDVIGIFIALCRAQWIYKNDNGNFIINKDDTFKFDNEKYFHVNFYTKNPDRYKRILTILKIIENIFNIQIDVSGKHH